MKNIAKVFTVFGGVAILLTGCVKETQPTNLATKEQVGRSAVALSAMVSAMPAQLVQGYLVYGEQYVEYDMGYPGLMITLDSAAGEIVDTGDTGYDWYSYWSSNQYQLGANYVTSYVPWRAQYMFVKSANDVISAIDPENASEEQLKYLGQAYAYRAMTYLNLVRMYEYKAPTDPAVAARYAPENNIAGLAVPIVTEKTTQDEGKNNPRATVDEVYALIFSDLEEAEKYLVDANVTNKLYPSISVVYGLKARAYLEKGSAGDQAAFASAAEYARKAIDASGCTPLTQDQWEDPANGFNNAASNNSWMLYLAYSAETMGNLCNFVAHMSAEEQWTSYGWAVGRGISKSLYNRIPDTDFRKHSWIDPDRTNYYAYKTANPDLFSIASGSRYYLNSYTNLKFRPAGGDFATYKVGGASNVPLMRVEEMMLIEAEALAMSGNLPAAKSALNALIQTRNPEYSCDEIASAKAFQNEVFFQKRIELWGEGLIYFDAKRLAAGVHNGYAGTNVQEGYRYNCEGIAPWWNFVIPRREVANNPALDGFNNPDPTNVVTEWLDN